MASASRNAGAAVIHDETTLPLSAGVGELAAADLAHEAQFRRLRHLLEEETFRVEFFQAVRLLQRLEPHREPVGYFIAPGTEAVRFSSLPTLSFPPSQLYGLDRGEDGQLRLVVQFMGIAAAVSILPHAYTEHLLVLLKDRENAMAEFFDIFNHRLISLFYRSWEKYRFFLGFETGGTDSLSPRLLDLLGLGTNGLRDRTSLPDRAYMTYAGLLGNHVRSAASLKQILEDYFAVPVAIEQFAGTWRTLPAVDLSVMDGSTRLSERLGVATVVGTEVWDHHGRIRISLGPMPFAQYLSFLPGRGAHADLESWVKFFSSGQYEAEVQLILEKIDAPPCELGLRGEAEPRLGLVSWMKTKPLLINPGDAVFLLT